MCATCGCGRPEDQHDDDRHILWSEIVAAAEASEIDVREALLNVITMFEQHGESEGEEEGQDDDGEDGG